MCGIAGFTNQLDKENITLSAQESLRLRGPDESFYFTDSNITLINTRLKVRDLNHGSQPFSDSRKKYTLVYNGEIYNTDYLKTKLSQFKISFTSTSDTEILFWSLVHFGTEIIKEIDGMFAFAFYNNEKNQIIIARDRYGVKPLFFKKDDHFSFASDIKTLTLINKEKKINPNGIIDFLSHNYISDKLTIFEDIHVFPQGHYAVYTDQSLTLNEYWDLPKPIKNEVDYEKVDELLSKATERQLVSDRPLGVFLSSGIDSATIAYYAKQRNSELNTYSVGFQNKYFDETEKAKKIAKTLGTNHLSVEFSPQDFIDNFKEYIKHSPSPISDLGMYPLYFLTGKAKESSTVLLSGDGGDEIFGGYPTLKASSYQNYLSKLPEVLTDPPLKLLEKILSNRHKNSLKYRVQKFRKGLSFSNQYSHYYWRTVFDDKEKNQLYRYAPYNPAKSYLDYFTKAKQRQINKNLDQYLYTDFKVWLPQNNFTKVDQATMAHSVEARVPFLDNELVEYLFSIPASQKIKKENKHLLRKSMLGKLPEFCVKHKKEAFHPPYINWFQNELYGFLEENLLDSKLISEYQFSPIYIKSLLTEHKRNEQNHAYKLYNLIYLEFWLREHS